MPKISEFFGINIYMYRDDHHPAHFHAIYGDKEASIQISPVAILRGNLPPLITKKVVRWATVYQKELLECWKYATDHKRLPKIPPLQ